MAFPLLWMKITVFLYKFHWNLCQDWKILWSIKSISVQIMAWHWLANTRNNADSQMPYGILRISQIRLVSHCQCAGTGFLRFNSQNTSWKYCLCYVTTSPDCAATAGSTWVLFHVKNKDSTIIYWQEFDGFILNYLTETVSAQVQKCQRPVSISDNTLTYNLTKSQDVSLFVKMFCYIGIWQIAQQLCCEVIWQISKWLINLENLQDFTSSYDELSYPGIVLGMGSASERRHYIIMPPLIGWTHNQNDPCYPLLKHTPPFCTKPLK